MAPKKGRGKHKPIGFTTEESTVKASLFVL